MEGRDLVTRFCYCVLEVGFVEVGPGLLCLTSHTDVRPRAETGPVTSRPLRQELAHKNTQRCKI